MTGRGFVVAERVVRVWSMAFAALMTFWTLAELGAPGRQYADPLLPCVAHATLAAFAVLVWSLLGVW